jgi:hypothetical protein
MPAAARAGTFMRESPGEIPRSGLFHAHGYRSALHPFSEDAEFLYGRGVCDAKGIIAAQVAAAEALRAEGFGLDCCL